MIRRISGTLERVEGSAALVQIEGSPIVYEVLLPVHLAARLADQPGPRPVTFHTMQLLEGLGQGTSFVPRLLGFASESDRKFFELFTTVKGIGNRKALRAMAQEPAWIAAAIARKDAKALQELPEIGKRMAETVVAELFGKVDAYLLGDLDDPAMIESRSMPPAAEEAISALVALGQPRTDAERMVARAIEHAGDTDAEAIVAAAFAGA